MNASAVVFTLWLSAGLLVWLLPERWWRALAGKSRWANQTSTGALLLFCGMTALGGWIFAVNAGEFHQAWQSENWRRTTGTVVAGRVVEVGRIRSSSPAFRAQVDYVYDVGGRGHRGGRLAFGASPTGDREWVEQELRTTYAKGTTLPVFYDPEKPWKSVLKPGWNLMHGVYASLALVFMGVGGYSLRMLHKSWEG